MWLQVILLVLSIVHVLYDEKNPMIRAGISFPDRKNKSISETVSGYSCRMTTPYSTGGGNVG